MGAILQKHLTMNSDLGEIPAMIGKLLADGEVRSCIRGREVEFTIAMREALWNAVWHGNHKQAFKLVHVGYACSPGPTLTIVIRDEGEGFDPSSISGPNEMCIDQNCGIHLMRICMDEIEFHEHGTEVHMRMEPRCTSK